MTMTLTMRIPASLLLTLATSVAPAVASPKTDAAAAAAIAAANQAFSEAYAKRSAAAIAALYSADAQLLPPDGEFVRGRAAIQEFWKNAMLSNIPSMTLKSLEIKSDGTTAYEVGRYSLSGTSGRILSGGKYIVIWKREGDAWRLFRDIWNGAPPERESAKGPQKAKEPEKEAPKP
jgi:ketosteroid isomerase-like protein